MLRAQAHRLEQGARHLCCRPDRRHDRYLGGREPSRFCREEPPHHRPGPKAGRPRGAPLARNRRAVRDGRRSESGTPGLIPDATFVAVNAFFTNSKGELETDTAHLTEALAKLDEEKVRVVNLSFVGPKDKLVHDRIIDMAARGVVFVAAAGNGGPNARRAIRPPTRRSSPSPPSTARAGTTITRTGATTSTLPHQAFRSGRRCRTARKAC